MLNIGYFEERAWRPGYGITHHRRNSTLFKGGSDMLVAIVARTFDGKEQISGIDTARIDTPASREAVACR